MAVVVQCLLVLALLVVHSQGEQTAVYTDHYYIATLTGQSEGITGLVDSNTLTEWSQFAGIPSETISSSLGGTNQQFLFTGMMFRCNGMVTKWIVGAAFAAGRANYPALGIYGPRDGNFADRVGASIFVHETSIASGVYEFTPNPPLPFCDGDSLGIFLPPNSQLRIRPFERAVTDGPTHQHYIPPNPTPQGVENFDFAASGISGVMRDRLPLVAVEIESDDPDSADCTRDFLNRDLLELLAHSFLHPPSLQIVFPSYIFTGDGLVTSWTVAGQWFDEAGRNSFPELQIWRRRNGDTYDKIDSTTISATAESPNQLYSGTIDPPLQFQSGDVLGMYIPPEATARLRVTFGDRAGPSYEVRTVSAPLSSIALGSETGNHRPYLALEIGPEPTTPATTQPTTTASATTASTSTTVATTMSMSSSTASEDTAVTTAPSTPAPSRSPTTELPCLGIGGVVGVFIGGVAVGAVAVLIVLAVVLCARKKSPNPKDRSVDAINMAATTAEEVTYDNPFQQETIVSTKRNEAYATTAVSTAPNQAYGTARGGNTATAEEYDYI